MSAPLWLVLGLLAQEAEGDEEVAESAESAPVQVRGSVVTTLSYLHTFFVDTGYSSAQLTTADRQIVSLSHDADADFGYDLKLQLSTDLASVFVGMAGGLRAGSLAVQTEFSRAQGELLAKERTLVDPREPTLETIYLSVRMGYDLRNLERADYRRSIIVGGGVIYQTSPMEVLITGLPGGTDGQEPSFLLDRSWNSLLVGGWVQIKALPALVSGEDVWMPTFAEIARGELGVIGVSLDFAALLGIGAMWPGDDHDALAELLYGQPYMDAAPAFAPVATHIELALGLSGSFSLVGIPVGIFAGVNVSGTMILALRGEPDEGDLAGLPPFGVMRLAGGPQVDVAFRF